MGRWRRERRRGLASGSLANDIHSEEEKKKRKQTKGKWCCGSTLPLTLILIQIQMSGKERSTGSEMEVDMDEVIYQKRGRRMGESRKGSEGELCLWSMERGVCLESRMQQKKRSEDEVDGD